MLSGLKEVEAGLNKAIAEIKETSLKGLIRAAIVIRDDMEHTPPKIPVDLGNLRASCYIAASGKGAVESGSNFTGKDASRLSSDHSQSVSSATAETASDKNPSVIIGFSAYYAVYVHEMPDTNNFNRAGSGPKFLEDAIKRNEQRILSIIAEEAKIP